MRVLNPTELQSLIEEATFDYTMGENEAALAKLGRATTSAPDSFAAWHALAAIYFSLRRFDEASDAAEKGHAIQPTDLLINPRLSRIVVGNGDKATAAKFGAQAKIQSWKDQLKSPETTNDGL